MNLTEAASESEFKFGRNYLCILATRNLNANLSQWNQGKCTRTPVSLASRSPIISEKCEFTFPKVDGTEEAGGKPAGGAGVKQRPPTPNHIWTIIALPINICIVNIWKIKSRFANLNLKSNIFWRIKYEIIPVVEKQRNKRRRLNNQPCLMESDPYGPALDRTFGSLEISVSCSGDSFEILEIEDRFWKNSSVLLASPLYVIT